MMVLYIEKCEKLLSPVMRWRGLKHPERGFGSRYGRSPVKHWRGLKLSESVQCCQHQESPVTRYHEFETTEVVSSYFHK